MARRKLSKTRKAKNKAAYKNIRKEYEKVKSKAPVSYVQFKRRVKARAEKDGISIKEAAKKEARTENQIRYAPFSFCQYLIFRNSSISFSFSSPDFLPMS